MADIIITTDVVQTIEMVLTKETGRVTNPTLQTTWDGSTDPEKNTFVDDNDTEILTYIGELTWAQLIAQQGGIGYNYASPTGQTTTVYRPGDDKDTDVNIWSPARLANKLQACNSLATFSTLNNNNTFGNTNRFTDSVGGQDYDGTNSSLVDYLIDHYTGIGWFTSNIGNLAWNAAIDNALAATNLSFTDWVLPNVSQLKSVVNMEDGIVSQFDSGSNLATSTTYASPTTSAIHVNGTTGMVSGYGKAFARVVFICRKHY